MNTAVVNVINEVSKIPNVDELLPKEMARAMDMKEQGLLRSLFLKKDGMGTILVFVDVTLEEAKELMATLPIFQLFPEVIHTETERAVLLINSNH